MTQSGRDYDRIRDRELNRHLDDKFMLVSDDALMDAEDARREAEEVRMLNYIKANENMPAVALFGSVMDTFGVDSKRTGELIAIYIREM